MDNSCSYQQNITEEITMPQLETDSMVEDASKVPQGPYHQKLASSFISPKDWQKYLKFIKLVKMNPDRKFYKQKGKNAQIHRLFYSFYALNEEYSFLCSRINGKKNKRGITKQNKMKKSNNIQGEVKDGDKQDLFMAISKPNQSVLCQTTISATDDRYELKVKRKQPSVPTKDSYKLIKYLLSGKRMKKRYKQKSDSSESLSIESKCYDKVSQPNKQLSMHVLEEYDRQLVISHKISAELFEKEKLNFYPKRTIKMPLAIELLLPKIQIQIEAILKKCPFLCDPFEVAAELRGLNYNKDACINYFHSTKFLRTIIENLTPVNDGNETPNNSSSAISKNLYGTSDDADETLCISTLNNNTNNINVFKFLLNISSVNNIFTTIKNLLGISRVTRKNDGTNFYLDNKKFTGGYFQSFFINFTNMRQLYFDTGEEMSFFNDYINVMVIQNNELIYEVQDGKLMTFLKQIEGLKLKLKDEIKHGQQMGNIQVYCRYKHIDNASNSLGVISREHVSLPVSDVNDKFELDKVFSPSMMQQYVFEKFRPLVSFLLDGYNVRYITYGGKGSGKVYALIKGNSGQIVLIDIKINI